MLTLFSIPKAFKGHIGIIQWNAITSWTKLKPRPEIILFGRDDGMSETARQLGLRHVADVAVNEHGTPLLNDLFQKAEAAATYQHLCYVNADIILLGDFLRAIEHVQARMPRSLTISRRINLDIDEQLDFNGRWEESIRQRAATNGQDGHYSSIDAFAFPKGMYPQIPPFAIGRLWWDHWLIKAVRIQKLPVIDASRLAPLLHQNHDYNHVPGGADELWRGQEAETNFRLSGGVRHAYTLLDVTHELLPDGRVRRVRFRKEIFKVKSAAWEIFVKRTARARHILGLRRKNLHLEQTQTR
jgi:hypothetical protein